MRVSAIAERNVYPAVPGNCRMVRSKEYPREGGGLHPPTSSPLHASVFSVRQTERQIAPSSLPLDQSARCRVYNGRLFSQLVFRPGAETGLRDRIAEISSVTGAIYDEQAKQTERFHLSSNERGRRRRFGRPNPNERHRCRIGPACG